MDVVTIHKTSRFRVKEDCVSYTHKNRETVT